MVKIYQELIVNNPKMYGEVLVLILFRMGLFETTHEWRGGQTGGGGGCEGMRREKRPPFMKSVLHIPH